MMTHNHVMPCFVEPSNLITLPLLFSLSHGAIILYFFITTMLLHLEALSFVLWYKCVVYCIAYIVFFWPTIPTVVIIILPCLDKHKSFDHVDNHDAFDFQQLVFSKCTTCLRFEQIGFWFLPFEFWFLTSGICFEEYLDN